MISRPARRAFTLVEMLIVISILGIVIAVEGRFYHDTLQAIQSSNAAENQINSLGQMSSTLRQDVWGASSIEMPDSRTIVLGRPGGVTARWRLSDTEIIRATGSAEAPVEQKWEISLPLHARREGASVVLYAGPEQDGLGAEMRFVSQVMLARGNP